MLSRSNYNQMVGSLPRHSNLNPFQPLLVLSLNFPQNVKKKIISQLPSKLLTLGLMETLDLFFQKGLLSSKRVLQKDEKNKSCRKTMDLQIRFGSFLVQDSFKEAIELAKKRSKVSMRSKVRGFYGNVDSWFVLLSLFVFWKHKLFDVRAIWENQKTRIIVFVLAPISGRTSDINSYDENHTQKKKLNDSHQ